MGFFSNLIATLEARTEQILNERPVNKFVKADIEKCKLITLQQLSRPFKEYLAKTPNPLLHLYNINERMLNEAINKNMPLLNKINTKGDVIQCEFNQLPNYEIFDEKYVNYRHYELPMDNRLELTLVFPVTTDMSIEMSLYVYFKKLNIKYMFLNFLSRDDSTIITKKQTLLSSKQVEEYLTNWSTQTQCAYFEQKVNSKCKHCTIKDICEDERTSKKSINSSQ